LKFIEAHVEHLLGSRVVDVNGVAVGKVEEMRAETIDGETVVTEFHLGTAAVFERIGAFVTQLPFFRHIPYARRGYRVRWNELDLSNPYALRVTVRRDQLARMELDAESGKR